jgi:hypothetical protein
MRDNPEKPSKFSRNRNKFQEAYGKIGETGDRFDVDFRQTRGEKEIFEEAERLIRDYLLPKGGRKE